MFIRLPDLFACVHAAVLSVFSLSLSDRQNHVSRISLDVSAETATEKMT